MTDTKIIVLDDDPTGSQTVHSCLLLTRWDVDTLKQGLLDEAPLFFVLTNTRGMSATQAANLTREVCVNLRAALEQLDAQTIADVEGSPVAQDFDEFRGERGVLGVGTHLQSESANAFQQPG